MNRPERNELLQELAESVLEGKITWSEAKIMLWLADAAQRSLFEDQELEDVASVPQKPDEANQQA